MSDKDIVLIHPDEINIKSYEKGIACVEITLHELQSIGNCLNQIQHLTDLEPFQSHSISILNDNYKTMYNRLTERDGKLIASVRSKQKLDNITMSLKQLLVYLKDGGDTEGMIETLETLIK